MCSISWTIGAKRETPIAIGPFRGMGLLQISVGLFPNIYGAMMSYECSNSLLHLLKSILTSDVTTHLVDKFLGLLNYCYLVSSKLLVMSFNL